MRRFSPVIAFACVVIGIMAGCSPAPEIVTHEIPRERSGLDELRNRMVVAMFEQPEKTWFFKVTGPPLAVEDRIDQITDFFQAVEFEEGSPSWELPEQWSRGEPRPMRVATLVVQQTPLIELAISDLGAGQDRLLNVNRWLEQLQQPPIELADLDQVLIQQEGGKNPYLLFDQSGVGEGFQQPPFAGGMGMPPSMSANESDADEGGVKYTVPGGWIEGNSSAMVKARLKKLTDAEEVLEMTLIVLPADKNDWVPNIVRWLGQIGMELDEDAINQQTEEIVIDGLPGQQIKLIDESKPEAIIGALVKQDQNAWFVKLKGPTAAVQEHLTDFQRFLNSIKF